MGDFFQIGDAGFKTGFHKSGKVEGIMANFYGEYSVNTPFGKDKKHIAFTGTAADFGIYVNDNTDNLVHFAHGAEIFSGVDFAFNNNPNLRTGTKLQLKGQYKLFNGVDKQFGTAGIFQNSYYVENDAFGVNLDLNYKYKNYGCYADKIKMNKGEHYVGSGLELSLKPEKSNITLFANSNVEFPVKKTISPKNLEGDISIGLKINF